MKVLLVHRAAYCIRNLFAAGAPGRKGRTGRAISHDVRLLDLQVSRPTAYTHEISTFQPQAIGFSLNYLANVPEVWSWPKRRKRINYKVLFRWA
jgi:magnesium-protoporphyrin IX monomethyl ester (oxidative) cyclase